MACGCFIEDIELSSYLSIKAKYFWPEGDRFHCTFTIIAVSLVYKLSSTLDFSRVSKNKGDLKDIQRTIMM